MESLAVPILARSSAFSFPHNPVCDAIRISSVFEYLRLFREYSLMVEHEVRFGWRSGYLSILHMPVGILWTRKGGALCKLP